VRARREITRAANTGSREVVTVTISVGINDCCWTLSTRQSESQSLLHLTNKTLRVD